MPPSTTSEMPPPDQGVSPTTSKRVSATSRRLTVKVSSYERPPASWTSTVTSCADAVSKSKRTPSLTCNTLSLAISKGSSALPMRWNVSGPPGSLGSLGSMASVPVSSPTTVPSSAFSWTSRADRSMSMGAEFSTTRCSNCATNRRMKRSSGEGGSRFGLRRRSPSSSR